jgi:hypothetical protein
VPDLAAANMAAHCIAPGPQRLVYPFARVAHPGLGGCRKSAAD